MARQVVYVHGAGPQKPAGALKAELDSLLFGKPMATTRVAYYADVRWGAAPAALTLGAGGDELADGPSTRTAAIEAAADGRLSASAAATLVVARTLAGESDTSLTLSRSGKAAGDELDARRLVTRLYRRADRIAGRSAGTQQPLALGMSFPDPIFRLVVGHFASDVVDYLYGPYAEVMRAPVRDALIGSAPPPDVIVAHSLGTIILYDVLSEPACAGLKVALLVTAGCPLGIGNVQKRLAGPAGTPKPVPGSLAAWANFADRWDPVALDPTMRDSFAPPKAFATDAAVNNPAPNNHDLTGYLKVDVVRSTILNAVIEGSA